MCGRKYNLPSLSWEIYRQLFDLGVSVPPSNFPPNYNIAPTHDVPVVYNRDGNRVLNTMRWGLLPFWAKEYKVGYRMINAKAETLEEKRSFSPSLKSRRCIIPVSGFYEWKRFSKTEKQAYAITSKDNAPLLMAGIWTSNSQIEPDTTIQSYAVITREPNELVADIHNRMPAILDERQISTWLEDDWQDAKACLAAPYPSDKMKTFAVSNEVGKVANNYPELAQPLKD